MSTKRTYQLTDDASGSVYIEMEAESAEAALAEYITDALRSPHSYNQGEDGVATRIHAYASYDDPDTGDMDEADGWIDFGTDS